MCLIAFALAAHPRYRLVLAGNRDEFLHRATAPLGWWPAQAGLIGGRDLEAGGTWLAMHPEGRIAALTNLREARSGPAVGAITPASQPSRGGLPVSFLTQSDSPARHAERLARGEMGDLQTYRGFNLLMIDLRPGEPAAVCLSNRQPVPACPPAGVHGLSNGAFDAPWPKLLSLKRAISAALGDGSPDGPEPRALESRLFAALAETAPAADAELPDTGVGLARERMLGAPFVRSADYGTRCSTVLLVDEAGTVSLVERTWRWEGHPRDEAAMTPGAPLPPWTERRHRFALAAWAG
ncbi:MAG: NRDE family protein [Betaproteobacteria bacterium]|nr:NRDE family protein [Betaproteobacteria bacterium]